MLSMVIGFLNIGTSEMLLIVFVALLLFGGKKLPELARGLGRGIREFKDASETIKRDISQQINDFEKDIEVKELIVEETQEKKPVEAKEEKKDTPAPAVPPAFQSGPPVGTYQHTPGREPDYVGSQDVYYNDGSSNSASDPTTPPQEEDTKQPSTQ